MNTMIPYESVFMDAMRQSKIMDDGTKVPFAREPAVLNLGEMGEGRRDYVPGAGSYPTPKGFTPDGPVGYVPESMPNERMPEKTYDIGTAMNGAPQPSATASVPEQPAQNSGLEEKERQIEQVAQNGTIEQLLAALRDMASMQPGEQGNPVFQLDALYKGSSALGGLPGTVAQYPTAGGMTRETDFSL
jgi:hypothetical protein